MLLYLNYHCYYPLLFNNYIIFLSNSQYNIFNYVLNQPNYPLLSVIQSNMNDKQSKTINQEF